MFAQAAKAKGLRVHAVAHRGETDPELSHHVDSLKWVRVGQLKAIAKALRTHGVEKAVMAGGIGRVRAFTQARPDWGALKLAASLKSLRDDGMLRAIAGYFEGHGIAIGSATELLQEVLAPRGHLAGPRLTVAQERDVALGFEVAGKLGEADVGQTVVVKDGVVLAVEAIEGTDETILRAGRLRGKGAVVVKRTKPKQDLRFDLPAIGPKTLDVMREAGAAVLAFEAGKTVVLDAEELVAKARQHKVTLWGATP
ncbi:MAG: UDP-2,3-diacylglucosamine diphosphatase LpxI [Myxococcaceae bacterium]|nr:UDP-2,3-diacylglucosamine diphosphatase LpxI [Myxococcaceae bacterium]